MDLRPKVLYVDDDRANLLVFTSSMKKHVDVRTATTGAEGLAILEREEIPVVISDQRMPNMSGNDFLSEVEQRFPSTLRMIVTAYTSFKDAVDAINRGRVFRFVKKPWRGDDLLIEILNANELYHRTRENELLQEQLLSRERLTALGQLTAGLVHQLGNIAAILSTIEDFRYEVESGSDGAEIITDFRTGVRKLSLLTDTLRTVGVTRDLPIDRRLSDVGAAVQSAVELSRLFPEVRRLRRLEVVPASERIEARIDSSKLEQALLNLIKNAAEACDVGGGEVELRLERSGDRVRIRIHDNGPGIPPELAAQIFRGFFTTKGQQGTGLGLAISRRILEAHGGTLSLANPSAGGCELVIDLPLG